MAIIRPVVAVDRYDPDEVKYHLARDVAGVLVREKPDQELTAYFQSATKDMRRLLPQIVYVEAMKPSSDQSGAVVPHREMYHSGTPLEMPGSVVRSMEMDMHRLNEVDQKPYGRLASVFSASTNFRYHYDGGGTAEINKPLYLHRHMYGEAGLRILCPNHEINVREEMFASDANYFDPGTIKNLIASGTCHETVMQPGWSIFFNQYMAHASNPSGERERYIVFPFINPQAVL